MINTLFSLPQTIINSPQTLPYLSEIRSEDKELLQKMVRLNRPDSKNYEDSWGYIIQATRYAKCKWYDPSTDSLIFFGKKSLKENTLVIPLFFADPAYLARVLDKMQYLLKSSKTVLKNANPRDINKFVPYGFRTYYNGERWSSFTPLADQTFPQQIIDLKKLKRARGKKYHQLRRILNKHPNVIFREYVSSDYNAVLKLFALKDGTLLDDPKVSEGMYFASHAMYPTAVIDKFVIADKETGEIIGFTATSDISPDTTDLVASIFKVGIKVESVWGIYNTLIRKYNEELKWVNLGGCETEGTYVFLNRTFRPSEEIVKTHLVYEP